MSIQTQSFRNPGLLPVFWSDLPGRLAALLGAAGAASLGLLSAPLRALDRADAWLAARDERSVEQYLAESVDAVDLENRMRQLDRRYDRPQ